RYRSAVGDVVRPRQGRGYRYGLSDFFTRIVTRGSGPLVAGVCTDPRFSGFRGPGARAFQSACAIFYRVLLAGITLIRSAKVAYLCVALLVLLARATSIYNSMMH